MAKEPRPQEKRSLAGTPGWKNNPRPSGTSRSTRGAPGRVRCEHLWEVSNRPTANSPNSALSSDSFTFGWKHQLGLVVDFAFIRHGCQNIGRGWASVRAINS